MRTKKNEATIKKNHMDVLWHEYTDKKDLTPITGGESVRKSICNWKSWNYDACLWHRSMACP